MTRRLHTLLGAAFAGTALLHSIAVVMKRDALRAWTLLLAVAAFSLSMMGTFIVRSGLLTSVHAFAVDPSRGLFLMLLMGFSSYEEPLRALLPAAIYLGLHTLEGQIVTPIILGRRMALSPLVLILALMVFGWLWGIVGLLLAVPLLVCVKIVLTRVDGMDGWARLLE